VLQNKDEVNGDTTTDASLVIKNGSSPRFPFAAKPGDLNNAAAFETASGAHERVELEPKGCVPRKEDETPNNVTSMPFFLSSYRFTICNSFMHSSQLLELLIVSVIHGRCFYSCADNVATQQAAETQLTNPSPSDDLAGNNGMLNNPELAIDEGTISLSSQYSEGYVPSVDY
jgi:hypothetical protein